MLDAIKGIIKGKSCNSVFQCRFLVKGKYKAVNMHDVCLFCVHSWSSGKKLCETEAAIVSSLPGCVESLSVLISGSWDRISILTFTKWRNHNNGAVKAFAWCQSLLEWSWQKISNLNAVHLDLFPCYLIKTTWKGGERCVEVVHFYVSTDTLPVCS